MKIISSKSNLSGCVRMPGSKSHTIRAIAFASLASGKSIIRQPLVSLDTLSAVSTYRMLGAKIDTPEQSSEWTVQGFSAKPSVPNNIIDVGNSGTSLRMAMGTAALLKKENGYAIFTGDNQIRNRPSGPLIKSINELGGYAISSRNNDVPPFIISGKLTGGKTELQATSSQYLSALLVNCPFAQGDSEIELTLLNEKPYVEMTLDWLDKLSIKYENHNFTRFLIHGNQHIKEFDITIPADFSSATFFLCAAAIAGEDVRITGLDMKDTQGDKAVINYLKNMGAKIDVNNQTQTVTISASNLIGCDIDMNATPDAVPAMAVIACFAEGKTTLFNVAQARIKETDRLKVMTQELSKLGANIKEMPDGLEITHSKLTGGNVEGHSDHRVAMALAIAGLRTDEPVTVNGAEAVSVTFPDFVELMNKIGANMILAEN